MARTLEQTQRVEEETASRIKRGDHANGTLGAGMVTMLFEIRLSDGDTAPTRAPMRAPCPHPHSAKLLGERPRNAVAPEEPRAPISRRLIASGQTLWRVRPWVDG
jgi:hypothetical protein